MEGDARWDAEQDEIGRRLRFERIDPGEYERDDYEREGDNETSD